MEAKKNQKGQEENIKIEGITLTPEAIKEISFYQDESTGAIEGGLDSIAGNVAFLVDIRYEISGRKENIFNILDDLMAYRSLLLALKVPGQ